jgi:cell fate (sporulation/competence/biofilm development) regulator YlbF (YheA/YmcA/DUF963 family)
MRAAIGLLSIGFYFTGHTVSDINNIKVLEGDIMNHYDYAHNLARALKESEEYQAMLKAKEQMEADPKNKEMLLEFRKFQWEMQKSQALQEEIDEVTKRRMAQLGDLVGANSAIQGYLMAEYRFGQVMMDIQKILSDSLAEWFKIAAESVIGEEETPEQ